MKKILYASFFLLLLTMFFANSPLAAETTIQSGVPISAKLPSSSSTHKYQFTTDKDGEVYLTLEQTTAGFEVEIRDMYGKYIGSDSYSAGGKNLYIAEKIPKGTYYIELKSYDWDGITSASYRLKTTYAAPFTRNPTTLEPNDTNESSMSVKVGEFYKSAIDSDVDQDMYQFTTNRDGEVYITVDQTTDGFQMQLYNQYGVELYSVSGWSGGDDLVIDHNVPKGTYYVKVKPYHWDGTSNATYRFKATYASSFTQNSKTFEPNDTFETAMTLISNQFYSSDSYSEIDQDFFKFTTEKAGKAIITLDNIQDSFEMTLYDSHKNRIADDSGIIAGDNAKIEEILAKGTYYIKIDPYYWNGITSAKYRLKATFADKTPSVDSIYDTGTTLNGTAVSNTKVYAVVGSTKIGEATAKDGKYSIKIAKQKAGTKIGVYTIDAAGNRSSTKTTTVVSASIKVVSAGYNKLKVSWAQVPEAQGYEIYRSTSSRGTYSKVGTVTKGNTLTYTNSSLTTGKTYYYKVKAYRTVSGKKVYSPLSNVGNGKPSLATPSKLSVSKASATSIKTSWSKVSEANGYELHRATSKTGSYTKVKTVTSGSSISYTDTKLSKGKTYYYKVRAYRTVNGKKIFSSYTSIASYKM